MFEKDIEIYLNKHIHYNEGHERYYYDKPIWEMCEELAEFAYNKANEWHYVDRERLPEDKFKVLVQYVNGDYDIAFNFAGTWRGTSGNELRGAYAWKEIIPPKR